MKRLLAWFGGTIAVLAVLGIVFYEFILDWDGRPVCHKVMLLGIDLWIDEHGGDTMARTNEFPNQNGRSADSLALIRSALSHKEDWAKDYHYVPGLRQSDPSDLVLAYLGHPTRWVWHGPPPTVFASKAWIVVPVDFKTEGRKGNGLGELSERISVEEFQARLQRTLDFIRTNQRPNWQTIVAEHSEFLKSIAGAKPPR